MNVDDAGMRETFAEFFKRIGGSSRDKVLSAVTSPVLVQMTEPDGTPVEAFATMRTGADRTSVASGPLIAPLAKRAGNPFGMVTLGRAINNDIVLPYEDISKCHAFFYPKPNGWSILDAGSTNGTFVRGTKLAPRQEEILDLRSGSIELSFSPVIKCHLYTPEEFWNVASAFNQMR
jgi:hypothetical protein